jgi:pSer/pThr/pTyr-binding forkhead associated (FHA) protein
LNKFKVTIQRKDQTVMKEVSKDSFTIGRSNECDVHLNDTLISRVHVVFTRRWNQIWLEDKNSSNGTFLNGTRIVQGTPVNVVPADRIQLGRSEYVICVELETEEVPEELPKAPVAPPPEEEEPAVAKTIMMAPPKDLTFQSEKLVHDAKKKAAQIIMEGEVQAEKRVQAIYQKARDAQEKAESFYQTRLAEAHKEADAIVADFQRQGRELLTEARSMSQEIREEVDTYVQSLKLRAREDAEHISSEATLHAERLKNEAVESVRESAAKESEETIRKGQEEADRLVDFAKLKAYEIQTAAKETQENLTKLEAQLKELRQDVEFNEKRAAELKLSGDTLAADRAKEEEIFRANRAKDEENWKANRAKEEQSLIAQRAKVEAELAASTTKVKNFVKENEAEEKRLLSEKLKVEKNLLALKEKQAQLLAEVGDIEGKKAHVYKEYESQKVMLTEKMEKDKTELSKTEEQRIEEMRMQNTQRLQKMEREMLDEILRRKDSMVKEIFTNIEREVVKQLEPSRWRDIAENVESHIKESIEGKVSSMAQSSLTTEKPVDLMKKRKQEKWRFFLSGATAGVLILFGAQMAYEQIQQNQAPMQNMVEKEARKRKQDLEKRKFNPPQEDEWKDSYTDAVIYTRNFTDIYTDNEFQQKLYKASATYLLKTWRIDEQKTLQVVSATQALVKELQELRGRIHPDYVKQGIDKMHVLEKESRERLKVVLGSEVRLDSFRRFEKTLFLEEVQRRQMAQH